MEGRAPHEEPAVSFTEVRHDEIAYLTERRRWLARDTNDRSAEARDDNVGRDLVGLALSGGGIRSATTCLGLLQALARMRILPFVDYLSTVSGGGYIGSCLSALLSINDTPDRNPGESNQYEMDDPQVAAAQGQPRRPLFGTAAGRFPFRDVPGPWPVPPLGAAKVSGHQQVKHLRTHGNFLLTRTGLLSTETLRSVGGVLTGVAYHWLLYLLAAALLAALALAVTVRFLVPDAPNRLKPAAVVASCAPTATPDAEQTLWERLRPKFGPLCLAVESLSSAPGEGAAPRALGKGAFFGALVSLVVFIGVAVVTAMYAREAQPCTLPPNIGPTILAGARAWQGWGRRIAHGGGRAYRRLEFELTGATPGESAEDTFFRILLAWIRRIAFLMLAAVVVWIRCRETSPLTESFAWLLLPLATVLGFWVMASVLFVLLPWAAAVRVLRPRLGGLLWSRVFRSAWGSVLALAVYVIFATIMLALFPFAAYAIREVGVGAVVSALLAGLLSRALASRITPPPGVPRWIKPVLKRALLCLLVGVFIVLTVLIVAAWFTTWKQPPGVFVAITIVGLLALVGIVGNTNKLALHYFYRDRLMEAYLRTEVARDDRSLEVKHDAMGLRIKELHGVKAGKVEDKYRACVSSAPYHLVSAAINLAERRDLTRKDRKSGYFVFSKLYCGSYHTGFRRTEDYHAGEVKLSRAMTISGAAAGSGIGYQTFFAQAFAATLFNVRLGYWMENPNKPLRVARWFTERPIFSPKYLWREIASRTHDRGRLVNLSDGGHTGDNVGIYPLLQRRCRVIIACDAEADPTVSFGSFTEALRHAYIDMNIDVDIDLTMLRQDPKTALSRSHCAIGRIRYPQTPGEPESPKTAWLIYMKNTLVGDEPEPMKNYKGAHPDFPHESTVDQFFDDAQFESYRALGDHLAEYTFGTFWNRSDVLSNGWLRELAAHHSAFKANADPNYQRLSERLAAVEQVLTREERLGWYYAQAYLYAVGNTPANLSPASTMALKRIVLQQVRLMEAVYVTLDLGRHANALDNRGWISLFRMWARSEAFRAEVALVRQTLTPEFLMFYDAYLAGAPDLATLIPHPWDDPPPVGPRIFLDPGRREAGAA